ncbi:hypothetical protein IPdc08_00010 [archaeon]|nr:hypothetical protein IPdc08_00010 [archaeon]
MPRTFKFKQEDEVKRDYKKSGLKFNPFPLGCEPSKDYPYTELS